MGHGNGEMQATWDIRVGKCWHHGLRHVTHSSITSRKNQKRNQLGLSVPGKKTGALCPEFLNGKLQDINQSGREVGSNYFSSVVCAGIQDPALPQD